MQKGSKKDANWYESQNSSANVNKNSKKNKLFIRPMRNTKRLPQDFPVYSPVSQEEQYAIVKDRQKTRNYIDSPYKCEYCYKGFREEITYQNHMKKHDPVSTKGIITILICLLTFYPAFSRIDRGNLVLRHFIPHLLSIFLDTACSVVEFHAEHSLFVSIVKILN